MEIARKDPNQAMGLLNQEILLKENPPTNQNLAMVHLREGKNLPTNLSLAMVHLKPDDLLTNLKVEMEEEESQAIGRVALEEVGATRIL